MIGKALKNIFDPFVELDIQIWQGFGLEELTGNTASYIR